MGYDISGTLNYDGEMPTGLDALLSPLAGFAFLISASILYNFLKNRSNVNVNQSRKREVEDKYDVSLIPDNWENPNYFDILYGRFPGESRTVGRVYLDGKIRIEEDSIIDKADLKEIFD